LFVISTAKRCVKNKIQGQNLIPDILYKEFRHQNSRKPASKKDKYGGKYRIHSATIHSSPTTDSQVSLTLVSDP
jgi:hypothetical protein